MPLDPYGQAVAEMTETLLSLRRRIEILERTVISSGSVMTQQDTFIADERAVGALTLCSKQFGSMQVQLPHSATRNIPVGSWMDFTEWWTADVTIVGLSGVTVHGQTTMNRYQVLRAHKVATNEWLCGLLMS